MTRVEAAGVRTPGKLRAPPRNAQKARRRGRGRTNKESAGTRDTGQPRPRRDALRREAALTTTGAHSQDGAVAGRAVHVASHALCEHAPPRMACPEPLQGLCLGGVCAQALTAHPAGLQSWRGLAAGWASQTRTRNGSTTARLCPNKIKVTLIGYIEYIYILQLNT